MSNTQASDTQDTVKQTISVEYRRSGYKPLRAFGYICYAAAVVFIVALLFFIGGDNEQTLTLVMASISALFLGCICNGLATIVYAALLKISVMKSKYDFVKAEREEDRSDGETELED